MTAVEDYNDAMRENGELRERIDRLREIVTAPLSSDELRLVDKNCDWVAFGHAWRAVMKRRQEAVRNEQLTKGGTDAG